MEPKAAPYQWTAEYDPREQGMIRLAQLYREQFSHAGAPGHGQHLLIAKLVERIERLEGEARNVQ